MGIGNPFQVYFLIWFFIIGVYSLSSDSFIPVSPEFFFLILVAKVLSFVILLVASGKSNAGIVINQASVVWVPRGKILLFAQLLALVAIPLTYQKARELSGGTDIFTVEGYMRLRSSMTEDGQGFGILVYFSILSHVISSIRVVDFARRRTGGVLLLISVLSSLAYIYMGTGRTYILLLGLLMVIPLVVFGFVRVKGLVLSALIFMLMFFGVAAMTAKGVAVDAGSSENAGSLFNNMRSYTVAPLIAFSRLERIGSEVSLGEYSFRFFVSMLNAAGLFGVKPVALIKGYEFVPDATNVYTVYEVYFRDFSYVGIFIPPLFLIGHWLLYKRATLFGGRWVFLYASSVYPLVMQFFQDQYFSLFSMWLQIWFWYWILLRRPGVVRIRWKSH
jgi:oligosaccharide repeat unit polymerase